MVFHRLTQDLADRLAALALGHVTREYPNKLDHVLTGPEDLLGPRDLHPVFYGSFDWHSCVHSYWTLAYLYRRFPTMAQAGAIRALFDAHLVPDRIAAECAYLARPGARGFERPYGWAWLLYLAAELARHETRKGRAWSAAIAPLAALFADRFRDYLPRATYPVRSGAHGNTAFALLLASEYEDESLRDLLRQTALRWYGKDANCQAWEPEGDAFLSPALVEAACMTAMLPVDEFLAWFARFLPRLGHGKPATLFDPVTVSDRSDGKIVHLDGLNLSRAWCWRIVLPYCGDPGGILATAQEHIGASLPHLGDDYMGEHWLATFAVLALA